MKLTYDQLISLKGHALNMLSTGNRTDGMLLNDILDSLESGDKVVEAVRQDLLDRSNVGIKKYGTTLDSNKGNLRYWLNHSYEECLDMANYLKRAIMEIDSKAATNSCKHKNQKWNITCTSGTCSDCGAKLGNSQT